MSDVLVVTEQWEGVLNRMSLEAVAAGELLAAAIGGQCSVAQLSADGVLQDYGFQGKVYSIQHLLLAAYTSDAYVSALEQLIKKTSSRYVVLPHTYQVRDFAPALATRFGQGLISDVTAIQDGPVFVRQLMQGKLNADYRQTGDGPCFVSVQAGSFKPSARSTSGPVSAPEVEVFLPELAANSLRSRHGEPFREAAQAVDLSAAPIIVSVGRGIGEEENIALVTDLASALGAEVAASRPICDAGWLPMERQVGSSGQTVSPKLYVAIGISGAIQHLVGMKGSKTIVAINRDENAPIFEIADIGIVGDLFEVVPELTKAILASKGLQ